LLMLHFVNQRTFWRNIVLASWVSSRQRRLLEDKHPTILQDFRICSLINTESLPRIIQSSATTTV
jgi:hypothetical protein